MLFRRASLTATLAWCLALLSLLSSCAAFVLQQSSLVGEHRIGAHQVTARDRLHPALSMRGGAGQVQQVATQAQLEEILSRSGDALVVIDFTATWCSPCQKIAPEFEQLSQELLNVVFLKVDVDENEETAQKYDVAQMPTFLFINRGEVVDRFAGANLDVLRQRIVGLL